MTKTTPPKILFVMMGELGHVTFAARLKEFIEADSRIESSWLYIRPVSEAKYFWEKTSSWLPLPIAYSLFVRRRLRELLKKQKDFDAYFIHTYDLGLFLPKLVKKKTFVLSLDSTSRLTRAFAASNLQNIVRTQIRRFYRIVSDYLERKALKKADLIVSWSKWAAQSLIDDYKVPQEKIIIVPPALAKKDASYTLRTKESTGKLRLLFVGGDLKRKGIDILIALMNEGLENVCELDIVTKDKIEITSESIRLHYGLKYDSPELINLFAAVDVFILPTTMDMLAIVLIEACAAGLPSISTNIAAIPEVVEDGRSGFLIAPQDKTALKIAIERFVSDRNLCRTMGTHARAIYEQRFTAEEHFPKLIEAIYRQIEKNDKSK